MTKATQFPVSLGSDAWDNGEQFVTAAAINRIKHFQRAFNPQALIAYATSLRDCECTLSEKFSMGTGNFVKKITFSDGVEWIARIRLPRWDDFDEELKRNKSKSDREIERLEDLREMESELATMDFVRINTSIPIPQVHGYNLDAHNAVGYPFLIMDYVAGVTADRLAEILRPEGEPYPHLSIPKDYEDKMYRQLCSIMIELASIRFSKIGSIIRDSSDCTSFTIGPLTEGDGSGPYASAAEFYECHPESVVNRCFAEGEDLGQKAFVKEFKQLASTFSPSSSDRDGFGLVHGDLGFHNVIVDEEFNILAVIDWDMTKSVPHSYLYSFPAFSDATLGWVGLPSMSSGMPLTPHVRKFLAAMEEVRGKRKDRLFLTEEFFTKEVLATHYLECLPMKQEVINGNCVEAFKWLREHNEADIARYYHL